MLRPWELCIKIEILPSVLSSDSCLDRLTGVVTSNILGLYVPIVTTPNLLRICGSKCSITSRAVMASYPSNLELYLSIPPSQSSVLSGSQRGVEGGNEDVGVGGWMMDKADEVVAGFESRPPARWSLALVYFSPRIV